jgi:hypothetical protein
MDRFSIVILERTLELATEAMPPEQDSRVAECVSAIQQYLESPNPEYDRDLHDAVTTLLGIARENSQFLIAARLSPIAQQLSEAFGKSDVA